MDKDITVQDVFLDIVISVALIIGAWITAELGALLFPQGVPLSDSVLIHARTMISILWAIRMVARYSVKTYNEINNAIMTIVSSPMWQAGQGFVVSSVKYLWAQWKNMNTFSRYLIMIIIIVVGVSLPLFIFTQNSVDLWLPPAYGAAALLFAYLFERDTLTKPGARRYWLAILILFCILQIAIGIGIVDVLHLNNTNLWSEIWELIVQLPNTQLSTADNLRVLVSMSIMYIIADNVYQRNEAGLVNYAENMRLVLDRAKRGMNWCHSLPELRMVQA